MYKTVTAAAAPHHRTAHRRRRASFLSASSPHRARRVSLEFNDVAIDEYPSVRTVDVASYVT